MHNTVLMFYICKYKYYMRSCGRNDLYISSIHYVTYSTFSTTIHRPADVAYSSGNLSSLFYFCTLNKSIAISIEVWQSYPLREALFVRLTPYLRFVVFLTSIHPSIVFTIRSSHPRFLYPFSAWIILSEVIGKRARPAKRTADDHTDKKVCVKTRLFMCVLIIVIISSSRRGYIYPSDDMKPSRLGSLTMKEANGTTLVKDTRTAHNRGETRRWLVASCNVTSSQTL